MKMFVVLFMLLSTFVVRHDSLRKVPVSDQNIQNGVLILTDKNFDNTIKNGIVMVDFYATWCGPCKILAPIIEEIAEEANGKVKICKLDTDRCPVASYKYNIKYLPTVIIFKNGNPEYRVMGLQDKETLVKALNNIQE